MKLKDNIRQAPLTRVVPTSRSRMIAGFNEAGLPSRAAVSPGTEYALPDNSKEGALGGPTAGMAFPRSVRQEALLENPDSCVFCRMKTDSPQVDHSIPRARGGNATIENAQTSCPWCNASKGARDFPVNPPPGYVGGWPPVWKGLP